MSRPRSKSAFLATALLGSALLFGCGGESSADGKLSIVATTGHIHNALAEITAGADGVELHPPIYAPGMDPHTDPPTGKDVEMVDGCKAIFYNGFHLEAPMEQMLTGEYEAKAWAMSSAFPTDALLETGDEDERMRYDPHIWNHLNGWATCVEALAEEMAKLDADNADLYRKQGKEYADSLREADAWAEMQLGQIPEGSRFLVSTHDAFNYFAVPHGLETLSPLGISTDSTPSVGEMSEVVSLVCDNQVPVIFVENGTSPEVIQAIQEACKEKGWDVKVADQELFADTLGDDAPNDTFIGAFKSNVTAIRDALK